MSPSRTTKWILAFDASCGRCTAIADAARKAAGSKLEFQPLADPDIKDWRAQAMGADAAWVPTLLRVSGHRVYAWTGSAMGLRLLTRLGPRRTIKLLGALADLDSKAEREQTNRKGLSRKGFLRLGTGAGIAAGLILTGSTGALASDGTKAQAWARANKDRLPTAYDEFVRHDTLYRRAIFAELDAETRSRLWTSHIAAYRRERPTLTVQQQRVLDEAEAVFDETSTFDENSDRNDVHARLEQLRVSTVDAFGKDEAGAVIATLGPRDVSPMVDWCDCAHSSNWCGGPCCLGSPPTCRRQPWGCGTGYVYPCNGYCC